ncbi:hypothetical protein H8A99_05790 [Bradyrhizobium sp. Arg68]|uniref:DUF4760 domain-containing protein n=1 Tax=Bradyrhizobium ivorense TaxID=2511166 RepID=UPI001E37DD50|nr:hypothetical protein [Bradyrhizobium ivorense]MCC8936015.1 hypothetical protein [Bradyrhizobium ivorense]
MLLMLAAFSMGMMFPEGVHEIMKAFAELLTGLATIALVFVTFQLFKATNILARLAEEDSLNRRIQATVDAWMKLRAELSLPKLSKKAQVADIKKAGIQARLQLRKLEAFSQAVNSGAYDEETFNKISGSWFLQQVERIMPYIELKQKEKQTFYKEIVDLAKRIQSYGQVAASDDDTDDKDHTGPVPAP